MKSIILTLLLTLTAITGNSLNVVPNPASPGDLGTPTNRWPNIYGTNIYGRFYGNGAGLTNVADTSIPVAAGSGIVITPTSGTNVISLYVAPVITSFGNNQNSLEKGTTVTSTLLTWTLAGGDIISQSLNQSIGTVWPVSLRSYTNTASYTNSRTYTLTITDTITTNTANSSVTFYDKIYWGASTLTNLTDVQIIALSSQFATSRALTTSITTASSYMYVAYPASFGGATFTVGGFPDTGWTLTTRAFINASGYSSSYDIYKHDLATIGAYPVIIQ